MMKTIIRRTVLLLLLLLALCDQRVGATTPAADAAAPQAPAVLPGNGLNHRDFLLTGQLDDALYLVKSGQVVWSDRVPGAVGHVQEATLLSNGNLLLAYMGGAKEITPDKKVVWNYTAPPKAEIHTAKAIGKNKVLFVQNSTLAEVILADKATGKVERLFTLPVAKPQITHFQTRRAVLTDAGTLLLARTDLNKISEFDQAGHEVWSAGVERPWSIQRLPDGNTLVCSFQMFIRELDAQGNTVWEFTPADAPGYYMPKWCVATRLSNGNTLVANNTPVPGSGDETRAPVQAFEVSPGKKIVWALRSWKNPALGPAWVIQFLDEPGAPEDRHFGTIR